MGRVEPNELRRDALFALPDGTRSETLVWEPNHDQVSWRIEVDGKTATLRIRDVVTSDGAHELASSIPLAPCRMDVAQSRAVAEFRSCRLEIDCPEADVEVVESWFSPSYGVRVPAPLMRAWRQSRPGKDVTELTLRVVSS